MKKRSLLLLILAALLTGIALFYAWTDWSGARQLNAALAMLEAKHELIRFEDFIPAPIPDERNVAAAPIFREIFDSWRRKMVYPSRLENLKEPWKNSELKQKEGEGDLHFKARQIDPSFNGDESADGAMILKSLAPLEPILAEISEALQRADIVWPLDYSVPPYEIALPHLALPLRAAKIFQARALAEMATGNSEKALEDIQALLALAKISKEPHLLIGELVEISILHMASNVINKALNCGAWTDSQLATISIGLAQSQLLHQYAEALRWERSGIFQIDLSNPEILKGMDAVDWLEVIKKPPGKKNLNSFFLEILHSNKKLHLAIYRLRPDGWSNEDRALSAVTIQSLINALGKGENLTHTEIWDHINGEKNISAWGFFRTPIFSLTISAETGAVFKVCQAQTTLNSLSAACAVERYRLAHHQLPSSLNELVPALLPSVPKDPMTGGPLLYKPSPDGSFAIYGLGWNRKDEGGPKVSSYNKKPEDQKNWGIVVQPSK